MKRRRPRYWENPVAFQAQQRRSQQRSRSTLMDRTPEKRGFAKPAAERETEYNHPIYRQITWDDV